MGHPAFAPKLAPMDSCAALVPQVVQLVERAGKLVLTEYARAEGGAAVTRKADESLLTAADLAAHDLLSAGLAELQPCYPLLSEEGAEIPFAERARWPRYWLIDPLDGTKEFVERSGDFTVNVALIDDGVPVLGVVHAPVLGDTYWAAHGTGAFVRRGGASAAEPIHVADYRTAPALKVVVSRSFAGPETEAFLTALGACERRSIGSSLKFCLVAEGAAHLYPRFGPTMEWDVAAADAIVREAGGTVTDLAGRALRYNKPDLHNPWFVVAGDPAPPWQSHLPPAQEQQQPS
jgi:3'(2'), 5'-bisphosphate nucleotidase